MQLEPGLYANVPDPEYRAWDAVNASLLKDLARSPAHAKSVLDGHREPTSAMKLGSLIHTALLQPHIFAEHYAIMPDFAEGLCDDSGEPYKSPRATTKYKKLKADYQRKHEGKILVEARDFEICHRVCESVREHPAASVLLEGVTLFEASVAWIDPKTGLLCKGRMDALNPRFGAILDLKKTQDASYEKFRRTILDLGYHRAGAHYQRGARAVGIGIEHVVLIAVEDKHPYASSCHTLSEDHLELGRYELDELMAIYKRCRETGIWPGYSDEVEEQTLPEYHRKKLEQYRENERKAAMQAA